MLFAALTPLLIFIAFLLLLLVSLSVPVIKSIYLFKLSVNASSSLFNSSAAGSARFGVWGYCISSLDVSVIGIDHDTAAQCSKAKLGYTFDSAVSSALHVSGLENAISHTLTAVLVLHPIACGLTFLALLTSLFIVRRHYQTRYQSDYTQVSRIASLLTLGTGLIAALLTTIVFLIDVILVAIVRSHVNGAVHGDLSFNWGNAVWMALGATIALWIALVGACAGLFGCGVGRRRKNPERY